MASRGRHTSFANESNIYGQVTDFGRDDDSILSEADAFLSDTMIQHIYQRKNLSPQSKLGMATTVAHYVKNDIKKKFCNFCIGVMTVFLVVCFITTYKSAIDILPVALLTVS